MAIVGVILISITWATLNAFFKARLDITKMAQFYFAMSAYMGTELSIGVALYAALLSKVKQTTKNSSIPQGIDSRLTKTIAIIVAIKVVTYFPLMILISVFAYELLNSANQRYIQKLNTDLV